MPKHVESAHASPKYVAYLRVSTQQQGKSGLGLEAQRAEVLAYVERAGGTVVQIVEDVVSGKADTADRVRLEDALRACRIYRATFITAKLDRIGRKAHAVLNVLAAAAADGVRVVSLDAPGDDPFMLQVRASVAELEGRKISERTRDALAAAKARGTVLGGRPENLKGDARARGVAASAAVRGSAAGKSARELAPVLTEIQEGGCTSLRAIAAELNRRGIPTSRGGEWSAAQVSRVLDRVEGGAVAA